MVADTACTTAAAAVSRAPAKGFPAPSAVARHSPLLTPPPAAAGTGLAASFVEPLESGYPLPLAQGKLIRVSAIGDLRKLDLRGRLLARFSQRHQLALPSRLAYFSPVIEEVLHLKVIQDYFRDLSHKLQRAVPAR